MEYTFGNEELVADPAHAATSPVIAADEHTGGKQRVSDCVLVLRRVETSQRIVEVPREDEDPGHCFLFGFWAELS